MLSSDHHLRTPVTTIGEIAAAEGFRLNAAKTRVMGRGTRQTVTGIVVNARPNVPRAEYDELKAILHRASLRGPSGLDPAAPARPHRLGRGAQPVARREAPRRGQTLNIFWLYSV